MFREGLSVYVVDAPQTVYPGSLKNAKGSRIPLRDDMTCIIEDTSNQLRNIVSRQLESGPYGLPFYAGFVDPNTHTPTGWGVSCFPGDGVTIMGDFKGNLKNVNNSVVSFASTDTELLNDNDNNIALYEGDMAAGQFNGAGRFVSSLYEYEGEFRKGKRDGVGELRYRNKKYTGGFSNDYAHGKGKIAIDMENGVITVLSGCFIQGAPHGECTVVDSHNNNNNNNNNNKTYITFDHGAIVEQISAQERETRHFKAEISRLNKVVDEIETRECIICRDAPSTTVIPPCGHVCMCAECETRLHPKVCPFCRISYPKAIHLRFVS